MFACLDVGNAIHPNAIKSYRSIIGQALANPTNENVLKLGDALVASARFLDVNDPTEVELHRDLQDCMISIPNHAQYFADQIEREQKAVERYPTITGPRVSYDFNRTMHFKTLSHLPSPETIAVLGHFLSDDKDTPVPLMSPDSDWGPNPRANSYGSAYTIIDIGLRNPPVSIARRIDIDPDRCLATTRAWWDEVKSGKRTFSFLGQKVEYRFKPDGTWETIALTDAPDDAPKAAKSPPLAAHMTTGSSHPPGIRWGWIAAVVLVLLAGLAWLNRRKFQHGA